jgi:periplasmic divalent cation tolerance protein
MTENARGFMVVLTTVPTPEQAQVLALGLLEKKLAACVQIGAAITSLYPWEGRIETATEIPVSVKTTKALYPALEAFVIAHHPYAVPQILALPVVQGLGAYLDWVESECTPPR